MASENYKTSKMVSIRNGSCPAVQLSKKLIKLNQSKIKSKLYLPNSLLQKKTQRSALLKANLMITFG